LIGGEIPPEQDKHGESDNECNSRGHSDLTI
jgi:hypothetical protein